eukprot:4990740-Amphidinium_carterae.1
MRKCRSTHCKKCVCVWSGNPLISRKRFALHRAAAAVDGDVREHELCDRPSTYERERHHGYLPPVKRHGVQVVLFCIERLELSEEQKDPEE